MGAVMIGKCMAYWWVPLKKGEMHLVMDASVSNPIQCPFYLFHIIVFSFKRIAGGHCPHVVTNGDSITHKNFTKTRRLARDEAPFLLSIPPRATTLVW
jgi:hypothetical protein